MGINNLLTKIKLYYKILHYILILFYQKTKKIVTLILFNIIDHIKSKNKDISFTVKTLSKIINH